MPTITTFMHCRSKRSRSKTSAEKSEPSNDKKSETYVLWSTFRGIFAAVISQSLFLPSNIVKLKFNPGHVSFCASYK